MVEGKLDEHKFSQLLEELRNASTYIHLGNGAEISFKVGRVKNTTAVECVKNVVKAVRELLILFRELDLTKKNIRRIYLKTEKSESLPVFT